MARLRSKNERQLQAIRRALAEGRTGEAWNDARRLLAGRKVDAQSLNVAGLAAFHAGDHATAMDLLEDAVASTPCDAEVRMNLGNVLAHLGRHEEALAAYAEANELSPAYAEPAFNAGVLCAGLGRHVDAAAWFGSALDRDPDHAAAAVGRAEALRRSGDLATARAELQALSERRADDAVVWTNLAAVESALGNDQAACDAATRAVAADPGLAAAHYNLGVAQQVLGDLSAAVPSFKRALGLEPGHAAAALNLGEAAMSLGDTEGARAGFKRALDIDPAFAKAAVNLAELDLADGRPDAALAVIEKFLSRNPGEPTALAFKAIALRDAGNLEEAGIIDDAARFILVRDLDPPRGYPDLAAFNDALAEHLLAHPTLTPSPKAHATRAGRHSGELLAPPLGPMAAFRDAVQAAFEAYRRRYMGEPSHPFLDRCPSEVTISVWGVVMERDGHQVPHIHPSAWLSGVYYVEVPETVREDDLGRAGWIEFGRPPRDIRAQHPPEVTLFRPEPGRMLLFPSHFYHRTVPLAGDKRRISIAFDVMPA